MSDEEYVRSVWISNIWVSELNWYALDGLSAQQWAECAEFTRERLEQIRQVEEEIARLNDVETEAADWKEWADNRAPNADQDYVREAIRGHARDLRILGREQAALAELKQGMKDQGRV